MSIRSKRRGCARGFASKTGGNVAMMFGLLLFPLFLAAGAAVDFARAAQTRAVIQEAADAALLRAARRRSLDPSMTNAELTHLARQIFDAATERLDGVDFSSFNVVFDPSTERFSLVMEGEMTTSLLGAVGVKTLGINAGSEVKLGKPPYLEVVLALDNTGSMGQNGKLQSLKNSASALVESLFEHPEADIRVGLVPFAQYVNVGAVHAGASWMGETDASWQGCVGSRAYPANIDDAGYGTDPAPAIYGVCPQQIFPLSDDKNAMLSAVNAMTASGWTYISPGVMWGWRILSNAEPFTEGVTAAELAAKKGTKVLIVLTDGENTRAPSYPAHDSTNRSLADEMTTRACEAVKNEDIVIYSIAFDITDPLIRELMEDCATSPGHYFEAGDSGALAAAFAEIAASLRNISLSR